MSKAMGLLPSWYWPEGVQRYLAASQVPIYDLTLGRWARRYGDDVALIIGDSTTTFRQLDAAAARVAAACVAEMAAPEPRLALAVRDPFSFVALLLGALRANCRLLLLDPQSPADDQAAALALFQAQTLVTDSPPDAGQTAGVPVRAPEAFLEATATPGPLPRPDPDRPAIALTEDGSIVYHSHVSIMSAAVAFEAFSLLKPQDRMVVARPYSSWEGLTGLLARLQAGAAAVLPRSTAVDDVAEAVNCPRATIVWIDERTALGLLEGGRHLTEAIRAHCHAAYVSIQRPFPKRLRRQLRRLLRVSVLTVYGYPAAGAIAASHPSWYLDDAVGIPMTGVDLLPLEPDTRRTVEIPWEALSYAGIGVSGRSLAVEIVGGTRPAGLIEGLYYTGDVGSVDPNGMLYLLP